MKFFSFFISLMISFNLLAAGNGSQMLSQFVDEYHYSLTVEWDQKDKVAFQKINDEFKARLDNIILKGELSKEELVSFIESRIKNKKVLNDLKSRVSNMSAAPTSTELYAFFEETKSSMYSEGASWIGDAAAVTLSVVAFIGFIAILAYGIINYNNSCESEGGRTVTTEYNCGIRTVCVDHGSNYCHAYQELYTCDEKTECVY